MPGLAIVVCGFTDPYPESAVICENVSLLLEIKHWASAGYANALLLNSAPSLFLFYYFSEIGLPLCCIRWP